MQRRENGNGELVECRRCGRVFRTKIGKTRCTSCRRVKRKTVPTQRADKQESKTKMRVCHDCGKHSNGNYRCNACWSRIRGDSEEWTDRTDGDFVYA